MPRGWKPGRHIWRDIGHHIGPRGAVVRMRECTRCGLVVTSQAFSRDKAPWCYAQERIRFDGPGTAQERPPSWSQDDDGTVRFA